VNLRALGDLAEGCHRNVQDAFMTGRLLARLPPAELVHRYTLGVFEEGTP
jgi:hypothetical protein